MLLSKVYSSLLLLTTYNCSQSYIHNLQFNYRQRIKRKELSLRGIPQLSRNEDAVIQVPVNISIEDKEAILDQLGYIPSNTIAVSARREIIGTPLALQTYPLNGGASRRKAKSQGNLTPFPTLYWLCCPIVGKALADLERRGIVRELEQRLKLDSYALNHFIKSHEQYAQMRWDTLLQNHQDILENNLAGTNYGMRDMVRYSGIAGTNYKVFSNDFLNNDKSKQPSVKCVHAHYAHYRSQISLRSEYGYGETDNYVNIVGKWTHEILQEEFPDLML